MLLLIHDANVLIDLFDTGLLTKAMTLPCIMETTDLVQNEITDPDQTRAISRCVEENRLAVLTSNVEQFASIGKMQNAHPQLTLADCSVVFHAKDRQGIILSGDRRLRRLAENNGIEVHSTPWILNLMVAEGLLSPKKACQGLKLLMKINERLPHKKCLRLIETWGKMSR
jgi:predicted nucleic acid-binding protein